MTRITSRSWTPEHDEMLVRLAMEGASQFRAAAALNRTRSSVQARARTLGVVLLTVRHHRALMAGAGSAGPRPGGRHH